jgi:hypothetical protein
VTDSLGGRSQQRRVEITHDQGAARRSLPKWNSMMRPLGLRVPLTVGLCYRPAICPGHLIMMPLSAEPRGGSQCLRADGELWYPWGHERVSLVRCSREITGKGPDERSGPRRWQSTKTRGRLAALGVPALEAVWHRRQEECMIHM